jgi:hypothetical protein
MVVLHIVGGSLAVATGYVALFARKGAPLHTRVGLVFVYAMLLMGVTASVMAIAIGRESQQLTALLIAYFVITALTTVREPARYSRILEYGLMAVALGMGSTGITLCVHSLLMGVTVVDGGPVAAGVMANGVLLLAGLGDLRRLRAGAAALRGGKRLYRHLWRMCWAFFIASGSFFLGQADEIPKAIRYWPALIVLAFTPLLAIAFWAWRLRPARRERALGAMTLNQRTPRRRSANAAYAPVLGRRPQEMRAMASNRYPGRRTRPPM